MVVWYTGATGKVRDQPTEERTMTRTPTYWTIQPLTAEENDRQTHLHLRHNVEWANAETDLCCHDCRVLVFHWENAKPCDKPEGHAGHLALNGECPWCFGVDTAAIRSDLSIEEIEQMAEAGA